MSAKKRQPAKFFSQRPKPTPSRCFGADLPDRGLRWTIGFGRRRGSDQAQWLAKTLAEDGRFIAGAFIAACPTTSERR